MAVVTVHEEIDAPPARVWDVLADFPNVYRWNPGVESSHATSDQDTGADATRRCDLFGGGFPEERIIDFDPDPRMVVDIFETSLPLARNVVTFTVAPRGTGPRIGCSANYRLKYGPLGVLIDWLIGRRQACNGFRDMLRCLKYHVEIGRTVGRRVPD